MFQDIINLYPMCRSITGNGIYKTLEYIKNKIPITIHSVVSGTNIFDWKIPKEWNIKDAYIKNLKGEIILNFHDNYLHVLNYSIPINKKISFEELKNHIYTLPEYPDWIPYKTSYYKENWGFCMKHNDFIKMSDDFYEVFIDSKLEDGFLHYGDLIIKGESEKEILISSYCCHPQQCNDSLSGTVLAMHLANNLLNRKNFYTYRFVFIPETIGSLCYLHYNFEIMKKNIIGGYTITCVGDSGDFTYLMTRDENNLVDKITLKILSESGLNYKTRPYYECGSDERQYNYPNVNLNIGSLMRSKYGEFSEYHTSADNLNFVNEKSLNESYNMYIKCIDLFENNHIYINNIIGEPFMTKYDLYPTIGASKNILEENKLLIILKYLDGKNDIIDLTIKLKFNLEEIYKYINTLKAKNIIKHI